jgi:hypothetical protein
MKSTRICIALFFAVLLSSVQARDLWPEGRDLSNVNPGFYGGDGTSQKQAVIAVGPQYSAKRFVAQKYPGATIESVALVVPPGKHRYDVYRVKKRDGKKIDVWFQLLGGLSDLKFD